MFAGNLRFPGGDPASERLQAMARAVIAGGLDVLVASAAEEARPGDELPDGGWAHQGIRYVPLGESSQGGGPPWSRVSRYLRWGETMSAWVKQQDVTQWRAFVSAGGYAHLYLRLHRWLQRRGVPYVVDCIDWFQIRDIPGAMRYLHGPNVGLSMRVPNRRAGHIIAITRFVEEYYRRYGCNVVRVPPLIDLDDPRWRAPSLPPVRSGEIRLVYAGTPGAKDLLGPVVSAMDQLRREGVRVEWEVIGPTVSQMTAGLGAEAALLGQLGSQITCAGRIPASAVPSRLRAADFSVLLRPSARFAAAGFPTKVVESLAAGVPVIANRTSDIADYVHDGVEGLLPDSPTGAALASVLHRALLLGRRRWEDMGRAARARAAESFDYRQHVRSLAGFFGGLETSDCA